MADLFYRAIKKRTALHLSAGHGHTDLVQLLIGQGAEIDDPDEDFRTALHYAADNGHLSVARFLVHMGALCANKDSVSLHYSL